MPLQPDNRIASAFVPQVPLGEPTKHSAFPIPALRNIAVLLCIAVLTSGCGTQAPTEASPTAHDAPEP